MPNETSEHRTPSLGLALVPVLLTLLVLGVQLFYFGDFTPHIPLAFACWLAPVIGIVYALTGLFSPKATEAEITGWRESGEAIKDLSTHGFDAPAGSGDRNADGDDGGQGPSDPIPRPAGRESERDRVETTA